MGAEFQVPRCHRCGWTITSSASHGSPGGFLWPAILISVILEIACADGFMCPVGAVVDLRPTLGLNSEVTARLLLVSPGFISLVASALSSLSLSLCGFYL